MDANILKREIVPKISTTLKKYPITKAGLFGSILRKEYNDIQDVDILIEIDPKVKIGFSEYVNMKEDLEKILSKKVDLVEYKRIKPALKSYILPTEVRIYEKDSKASPG